MLKQDREEIAKEFKDENLRKVFQRVFDQQTIGTVHSLAMKGHFKTLESLVSEGKEALVFKAVDNSGNYRAVKVYKITASTFNNMLPYVQGDSRFKGVKKEKQDLVMAWCRKEFKNLESCMKARVKAPMPIAFKDNALVMEFVGDEGKPSPTLKTIVSELDWNSLYKECIEGMARMLYKARLVHADLSEYNILVHEGSAVFIDMGQAVSLQHPKAREFLERDLKNISRFFSNKGLEKSPESAKQDLKDWKELL